MDIRLATIQDKKQWLQMRMALWPDVSKGMHEQEISVMLADTHFAIFVAQETDEKLLGFLEVSLREDIFEGISMIGTNKSNLTIHSICVTMSYKGSNYAKNIDNTSS